MEFENEMHEDLFRLFITEFVGWWASESVIYAFELNGNLAYRLLELFPCENYQEEFEGWTNEVFEDNYKLRRGYVSSHPDEYYTNKIKFRFGD